VQIYNTKFRLNPLSIFVNETCGPLLTSKKDFAFCNFLLMSCNKAKNDAFETKCSIYSCCRPVQI
jgi:hypothetical protein